MCTVIVVNHLHKEFPLIVAANRDEDYNRKSSEVQILSKNPLIIGGKDELKNGTWLGVNENSIFVAITNQNSAAKNPKLVSRGQLVLDVLKCTSIPDILKFVENINLSSYNRFNLIFGNQHSVFVAHSYISNSIIIRELQQGVNVISSDMIFSGDNQKAYFVHQKLDNITDMPWLDYYKKLKSILSNKKSGMKIQIKNNGYCTKSSSILAFTNEGLSRYKFNDLISYDLKKKRDESYDGKQYKDYIDLWRGKSSKDELLEEIKAHILNSENKRFKMFLGKLKK